MPLTYTQTYNFCVNTLLKTESDPLNYSMYAPTV